MAKGEFIIARPGPGDLEALAECRKKGNHKSDSATVRAAIRAYLTGLKKGRR